MVRAPGQRRQARAICDFERSCSGPVVSVERFMAACPTATSCSMRSAPRWGNGIDWSHFDRRGHGFTADTDAPFHYADMATEAIGLLEKVVGGRAHLFGWSDGEIVGLLVAFRRPDLVDRPVLIGVSFHFDGVLPMELDPSSLLTAVFDRLAGQGSAPPLRSPRPTRPCGLNAPQVCRSGGTT